MFQPEPFWPTVTSAPAFVFGVPALAARGTMLRRRGMYQQKFYKTVEQGAIAEAIRREGFHPTLISDPPGAVYPRHRHPETKLLAVLRGGIAITVGRETIHCSAGDRLLIPGDTEHGAVVGPDGCDFFWSEKLL